MGFLGASWDELRSLEEVHFSKCLLDTDLHCAGNFKFARTTRGFPYQLKHFAGVRDSLGMDTTGKHCAPPRPTFSRKGWERKQGKKERGSGGVRRMWTRDVNRTPASKLLLDCAHLHVLMHHSSARNITFILQMVIYVKQLI